MTYILAVDDDPEILVTLRHALKRDDYEVATATSGDEALDSVYQRNPDLLILDIRMPGLNGIDLCKMLRNDPRYISLPILFLTANNRTDDVVEGLEAGADDYVKKPFELIELRARVHALLRRNERESSVNSNVLEIGDFRLDSNAHQVFILEEKIQLTSTEHRLLRYLMENVDQVLSLAQLLQGVWQYPPEVGDPDLVRSHIRNLRSKVEKVPAKQFIQTVHGVGYVFTS